MANPKPEVKPLQKSVDPSVRQKIQAAKTSLGMKDVNVSAALSAHQKLNDLAAKNPNMPYSRLINRIPQSQAKAYTTLTSKIPGSQLSSGVPLQKFRNTLRVLKTADQATQVAAKIANESVEFLDKEQISEMMTVDHEKAPPVMLVLRRKAIRVFPDGHRVALYENKQHGLVFTIPYKGEGFTPDSIPNVTTEEVEQVNEAFYTVHAHKDGKPEVHGSPTKFDGSAISTALKHIEKGHDVTIRSRDHEGPIDSVVVKKGDNVKNAVLGLKRIREEAEQIDENLDALAKISKGDKPGTIKFKDGSSTKVHPQVAGIVHQLHGALNPENKKKVENMIAHSAGQFDKIANFAVSKSQWSINK